MHFPICNFEKYVISEEGEIVNTRTGYVLSLIKTDEYIFVNLCQGPRRKKAPVHVLLAEAFLGKRPPGFDVNHKNGNKHDNRLENLEYVSRAYNVKHAYHLGLANAKGSKNGHSKLKEEDVLRIRSSEFKNLPRKEIADFFRVSVGSVNKILSRTTWKHI